MSTLADVVAALDRLYPPGTAESWDAVGLVVGDPNHDVRRVLLAVDPAPETVREALSGGFDLLLTHHPLYLRGTTTVAATTPKGRAVHALVLGGCGLFVAHTNADVARPGVSDALAAAVGLRDVVPLQPLPAEPLDKLVVFVPTSAAADLLDTLHAAGAGDIGDYDRCSWTTTGTGSFRPLEGANPAVGVAGEVQSLAETRVEVVLPRGARQRVVAALRGAHPYEQPTFDVLELAALPGPLGLGRVGDLPQAMAVRELVDRIVAALPRTTAGVRAGGDPDRVVRRLAVCGGAGDSLLREAAGAADAFLTADLRHHPASEAPEGLTLIDAAHWATEWPWLHDAAARLRAAATVETTVSELDTDPWTYCSRSPLA